MLLTDGYQAPVGRAGLYPGFANPPPWRLTLGYGVYYLLEGKYPAIHTGIDLSLEPGGGMGQPILAVANGTVTFAQDVTNQSWRKLVVIRHVDPDGTIRCSRYAHLQRIDVKVGQWVIRGQQIGTEGNAEGLFYPHLHHDIARGEVLVTKPTNWPGNDSAGVRALYFDPKEVIEDYPPMNGTIQQVKDLLKQIITLLTQVIALLDTIEETPPPPPPVDTDTLVVNSAQGLTVRDAASINGSKVGGLRNGDTVVVSKQTWTDGVYTFVRLMSVNGVAWGGTAYCCKQQGTTIYLRPQS